jgi:23S rRNA (guanosine2251-2'-O)-methyltransferase
MDFVYGRRPVLEALQAGTRSLHKIWIQAGTGGAPVDEIIKLARVRGVPLEFVAFSRLLQLLSRVPRPPSHVSESMRDERRETRDLHHQGVVAQVSAAAYLDLDEFLSHLGPQKEAVLVALDEIQDPQNIGAILRSAAFFGVSAVLVPRWRSAPVGGAAARVSSGAIEHLPLIRVRNLADSVLRLKEAGFEVVGADMEGSPLEEFRPGLRTVLVLGSEGRGLRRLVRERCDKLLAIPGTGPVASLNVGAAAAIFLYVMNAHSEFRAISEP